MMTAPARWPARAMSWRTPPFPEPVTPEIKRWRAPSLGSRSWARRGRPETARAGRKERALEGRSGCRPGERGAEGASGDGAAETEVAALGGQECLPAGEGRSGAEGVFLHEADGCGAG